MDDRPHVRRPSHLSRERRWGGLGLAVVLVGAALVVGRFQDGGSGDGGRFGLVGQLPPAEAELAELATAPEVGKLAPNFRLQTLDGQEIVLSDLRGRPVFLNFWATWCFPCVTEMPAMQRLADRYGEQIVVLGINTGEPADRARAFAANMEIRYPLVLDADTKVTEAYGVRAMPTSLFIDANGVVHSVSYGVLFPDQMEERLAPLLSTGQAARG
jgi:peroxiredoxin